MHPAVISNLTSKHFNGVDDGVNDDHEVMLSGTKIAGMLHTGQQLLHLHLAGLQKPTSKHLNVVDQMVMN